MYQYRLIDKSNIEAFEQIAKWNNDPDIKYHLRPNMEEGELQDIDPQDMQKAAKENHEKYIYLIYDKDKPIGEVTITLNFPHLIKTEPGTGWISICIGEKEYQGKGVAREAMTFLEETCRSMGLPRIELGVFEFNKRAISFYKKCGYTVFSHKEKFVWFEEKWHGDIRMEKYL